MSGAHPADAAEPRRLHPTVLDTDHVALARTYAEALVNAAAAAGGTEAAVDDLGEIARAVAETPGLADLLTGPALPTAEKDRLLARLFEGKADPTTVKFLRVLNRAGRMELLPAVADQAGAIRDARLGRKPVAVRTAEPLDEAQREGLRTRLRTMIGAEPVLTETVDPQILGGLVVQVGDIVYDASVRSRLQSLRTQLVRDKLQEVRGRLASLAAES